MGCGCGGTAKKVDLQYVHVDPKGQQHTFSNEYEARAAVLREGGSWRSEPKTATTTQ